MMKRLFAYYSLLKQRFEIWVKHELRLTTRRQFCLKNISWTYHECHINLCLSAWISVLDLAIRIFLKLTLSATFNSDCVCCAGQILMYLHFTFPFLNLERDENHIPKIVLKKLQKERVGNAMKSDAQRVAIDFTVIDCMLNKVRACDEMTI